MSKNALQMDFVRDAVREKATRELVSLNQRSAQISQVVDVPNMTVSAVLPLDIFGR